MSKCLYFFPEAPRRARVGPRVLMAPAVSEESILLLLVLLLPFGHLVELILGLPKDIMEISIREVVLQRERARRGQLWLLQRLGHLCQLHPFLTVPVLSPDSRPAAPVLLSSCLSSWGDIPATIPHPTSQSTRGIKAHQPKAMLGVRGEHALAGMRSLLNVLRPG